MYEIYIEKGLTFTLIDGRWDIQLWVDSAKPISAKVYRLRIKVPAELNRRSGGRGNMSHAPSGKRTIVAIAPAALQHAQGVDGRFHAISQA
jgi:hypothetical protein